MQFESCVVKSKLLMAIRQILITTNKLKRKTKNVYINTTALGTHSNASKFQTRHNQFPSQAKATKLSQDEM